MNTERRRFIRRTLGVAGYIALAVAIVPVVAVSSVYAYRTAAAAIAASHDAAAALGVAAANKAYAAATFAPLAQIQAGIAGQTVPPEKAQAARDALDAAAANVQNATTAATAAARDARDAASARGETGTLVRRRAVFSLAPLSIAGILFWTRRLLALTDEGGSA
jgi:uncharacterized membrane protein